MSRWATPIALFALALVVRASPWREVLGSDHVVPVGGDAFYHLRRILYAVFQAPATLDFDLYINFPNGAKPIWTPWFDSAIAALLRPWVPPLNQGGQRAVEAFAVWIPPCLGALGVVATWGLAKRHYGSPTALVAGGSLALLSGHFWYSQIGFVDHHVAVALFAVLLLAAGLAVVAAHEADAGARRVGASLLLGSLAAMALLLWPGCLLHVGLIELGLLGVLLSESDAARARALAWALAAGHALALVLVLPSGLASQWPQWGAYSPVVLSRFQPWLFAAAVGVAGGCAVGWQSAALGATRGRRALVFAALGVLALGLSLGLVPELRDGAVDAWAWLAKEDPFQARVSESQPLFLDGGRFTPWIAITRLSLFVLVFPVAALLLLWRERGRATFTRSALLTLFALGLFAVALLQKRFFNSASVGVALVLGLTFAELWRAGAERRWLRPGSWLGLAVCLLPATTPYARYAANEWRALRGEQIEVTGVFAASRAVLETASWLRTNTPPTRGWLRADLAPEYGVMAPWPLGHAIEYVGRRPTLVDNFGNDLSEQAFDFADNFYRFPEALSAQALSLLGVRYVIAQRSEGFLSRPSGAGAIGRALFRGDGAGRQEASGAASARFAPLERYRLVFESSGLLWTDPEAEAVYKVFELVPGAALVGRAEPGAAIELRLGVSTNRGRRFFYERSLVADLDGQYRVRVPYASEGGPDGIRVAPLYRLKCGQQVRGVAVSERAIRAGDTLRSPALCLESP